MVVVWLNFSGDANLKFGSQYMFFSFASRLGDLRTSFSKNFCICDYWERDPSDKWKRPYQNQSVFRILGNREITLWGHVRNTKLLVLLYSNDSKGRYILAWSSMTSVSNQTSKLSKPLISEQGINFTLHGWSAKVPSLVKWITTPSASVPNIMLFAKKVVKISAPLAYTINHNLTFKILFEEEQY